MTVFSGFAERVLPLGEFSKLCELSRRGPTGVFPGFDGRVLPLGDFSKLESSTGEWESSQVLPKEYCHWASSQLCEESRRGEWESSQVLTEEYCQWATSQNWRAAPRTSKTSPWQSFCMFIRTHAILLSCFDIIVWCGVISHVFQCWPFYHVIGFLNSDPFSLNQRYPFPLNHAIAILLVIFHWMAYHLMFIDHGRLVRTVSSYD